MIDGISIELTDFDFSIWDKHPMLEFTVVTVVGSGVEIGSRKAHYKGLDFIIEPKGKAKIKGSIHKFYNDGINNANRFTYQCFKKAVRQLLIFGVTPQNAILRGFEIGLNIDTSKCKVDTNTFLDSILYCRGAKGSDMEINGKLGLGYIYKTTNAKYKFYNKGEQSQDKTSLLRIETKFTRMRAVENLNIKTLADLLNPSKLTKLITTKFLKLIDQTIFFEWNQIKTTRKIPSKYKSKFKDLRNPNWWINSTLSRISRQRNKELLEKMIMKYAKRDIKSILKNLISFELAIFSRNKNNDDYNEFDSLNNWNHKGLHAKKSVTNTLRIVRCEMKTKEADKNKKYCSICGKEITGNNKNSKYCTNQRKCRDKAYNLKISNKRKLENKNTEKEIVKLINSLGSEYILTRTTNPARKNTKEIKKRKTSIVVTVNGKQKFYHGYSARFFLYKFKKNNRL